MLVLTAPSVHFCRICGRMCQLQDSKIDEHGLTVHAACQASRAVPMKSESALHANALRQNRPVEFLHGFAVKDF